MKKLFATLAIAVSMTVGAHAATYPTFVLDTDAPGAGITVTEAGSLCTACSLSADFSAGVDGASWTPTSATDSWTISNFIDWTATAEWYTVGGAIYDVVATIAFSDPDPASSTTTGGAGYFSLFGVLSAGVLDWNGVSTVTFAQGSSLDVYLEEAFVVGSGGNATTGVTFVGNTIAPVPLPAAGFLLIGALGGLGLMQRRRRKAA